MMDFFNSCSTLIYLDLSNNMLTYISGATLEGLLVVKNLQLGGNNIHKIDFGALNMFDVNSNLFLIDVSKNNLSSLS